MNIYIQIAILFLSVIVGGILVELFKKSSNLKLLLSFSGGFLLTIIFTHILPESYETLGLQAGYFILVGFLLQLILEYFSKGAEHGHAHLHESSLSSSFPLMIFISLSLHAFIEAIPLNHGGHSHTEQLYWGVFLHKIPVAVTLKTIFKAYGYTSKKSWLYLAIFGLMAPLGLLFGELVKDVLDVAGAWLLAIAIGMFLHISTTIIFESSEGHKLNILKLVAILLGFAAGSFLA
ncbi:MAG: ZIP family metal transporter [Flavobacteriales bacterium]|nr:ZIP family metal transporter [Flavobacteriales bacterium]